MLARANDADVIVVGAGPAGAALAYFLAERGRHVILLDKTAFPRDKTCGDCLSPRALRVLSTMSPLDDLHAAGCRINRVWVVAPNGRTLQAPLRTADDLPGFALIVPRFRLDELVRRRAVDAGVDFRAPWHVTDLFADAGQIAGVRAAGPGGTIDLRARVVVIGTGASTALLERAGLIAEKLAVVRAARAYYENVRGLSDTMEIYLHSVPMPGYGWVFPTSSTTANVGVGYGTPSRLPARDLPLKAMHDFVRAPAIAARLDGAHPAGAAKAYPLIVDFSPARAAMPGLMLVGEACGLVHPLTGEGIDAALESSELAAEVIAEGFARGETADRIASKYRRLLRDRFLRVYRNAGRVRDWLGQRWPLNRLIAAAAHCENVRDLFVQTVLGGIDPSPLLSPRVLMRIALG